LTLRRLFVRGRVAALIACSLIVTMLRFSVATAEYGIPAGSSAVVTAGAPLLVRATPGWDAEIAYEIADGSSVTVWGVEQTAPDGSLWYPVDGGFAPVDAVTSVATLKGGATLFQDATQGAEGVEPATVDLIIAEPVATEQGAESNHTKDQVDPNTIDAATDPGVSTTADDIASSVDPVTSEWVEPAPGDAAPVDPALDLESAPGDTGVIGGTEPWGQPIATAYIAGTGDEGATCHTAPEYGTETLAVLTEGQQVEVRGETSDEWQPVNCAGMGGYVHTSLLAWELSASSPESVDLEQKADKPNGDSGEAIVDVAMRYEGRRYVYAGEGPKAFDCSGFTMFVIDKALGIDISHDMAVQYDMGNQVNRKALQPGDLVFFENTFQRGLSHTGIYIGGGQFIHAENESTGVIVSELDSDYYSSRWYGAVRFA